MKELEYVVLEKRDNQHPTKSILIALFACENHRTWKSSENIFKVASLFLLPEETEKRKKT